MIAARRAPAYAARVPALRHALRRHAVHLWRRYRAVPGRYRWPTTLVLGLFLVVILANVIFGASSRSVTREFRIGPGDQQDTRIFVDAGRNSTVVWELTARDGPAQPTIEAVVTGPDFVSDVATSLDGRIDFKGDFTRSPYTFTMRNLSPDTTGEWRIVWTVR